MSSQSTQEPDDPEKPTQAVTRTLDADPTESASLSTSTPEPTIGNLECLTQRLQKCIMVHFKLLEDDKPYVGAAAEKLALLIWFTYPALLAVDTGLLTLAVLDVTCEQGTRIPIIAHDKPGEVSKCWTLHLPNPHDSMLFQHFRRFIDDELAKLLDE